MDASSHGNRKQFSHKQFQSNLECANSFYVSDIFFDVHCGLKKLFLSFMMLSHQLQDFQASRNN